MAELDAPIVAVTVYPGQARIHRRGTIRLVAGLHTVTLDGLPLGLDPDSVRVSGRGSAAIVGVEVARQRQADHQAGEAGRLHDELRKVNRRRAELADAKKVLATEQRMLDGLADRMARTFAAALADGSADLAALGPVDAHLRTRLTEVLAQQRELTDADEDLSRDQARIGRELADLAGGGPDTTSVRIRFEQPALEASDAVAELDVEVGYLVPDAGWTPRYDLHCDGDLLRLDWLAMVRQNTGEAWPACDLSVSTARSTAALEIPELDPWYVTDRPPMPLAAASAMPAMPGAYVASFDVAMERSAAPMARAAAVVEHGITAATYTVQRPAAIPPDGADHQVYLAGFELPARRDHVTAPVLSTDVTVRVVATNDTEHTLPVGKAALFHGPEFVGSTDLKAWAPGEERELALGLDERIRVERKLIHRSAGKALVGGTRRYEFAHRITVANHGPHATTVCVLDQLPVSQSAELTIKDVRLTPTPADVDDLGRVRWDVRLRPGEQTELDIAFRLDAARGTTPIGLRD